MSQVLDIDEPLTAEELDQVKTFAAFLVTRRSTRASTAGPRPGYVDVDAVAGLCQGMGGDKTSVELVHEALDERVAKYAREG